MASRRSRRAERVVSRGMRPGFSPASTALDESQFRALADTAPDAIVTGDADNRIAYANPAAERLFGHPVAEMVGRPITMLMPEDLRGDHLAGYGRFVATGRGRIVGSTVEVVALRADGHRFPIELSLGSAGEGASRTLTAVIRDLTDRHRRERHLAAQLAVTRALAAPRPAEETVERIVEDLTRALGWDVGVLWLTEGPDEALRLRHVWQADPEATSRFVAATAALGRDAAAGLPGRTLKDRAPAWYDDLTTPTFLRRAEAQADGLRAGISLPLLSEGAAIGVIECFTTEPLPVDDRLRDLLMTVAGQVGEHVQRRRTEERLEEERGLFAAELARSNRELEELAQVAAHDLNTPLRTIAGFAELLERDHGDALAGDGHEFVRMILDSALSGGRLLDNLLAYARAGASAVPRETLDLEKVVSDVVAGLRIEVAERDARITVGALPPVVADPVQAAQVLQNLIANAIKFTPADRAPVIEVSGERDGAMVRVAVRDHGIGIAPEEAAGLFEMFGRGAAGAGTGGAGIGLAVCAKIVDRHGGRLTVGPADGGGSVATFTLPAAPARSPSRPR